MNSSAFFDYPNSDTEDARADLTFLPSWTHSNWTRFFQFCQTVRLAPGDSLFSRGDTDRVVYLVALGRLEIVSANRRMAVVEQGAIIGEQPFLDGQPHAFDVRALSDAEVVGLRYETFEVFAAKEPELARDFLTDLGRIVSLRLRTALQAT